LNRTVRRGEVEQKSEKDDDEKGSWWLIFRPKKRRGFI
jgi:hypothetical protein